MKLNLSKFFQLKWNVALFRFLPYRAAFLYLQLVGKIYYLLRRDEKRLIEHNICDLLAGRTKREIRRIKAETFRGIFAHYFEKMYSAFKDLDKVCKLIDERFSIENGHVLDEALSRGKGVILVTAHWGAVEFIPWVLGLKGYPVSVILECQTEHLAKELKKKADEYNAKLISSKDGESVYTRALESLQENRLLMTECDEVDTWRKRSSRTIELFGKTLYFDNTLDIMAHRASSPVVGVFLKRLPRGRYSLICEPINNGKQARNTARRALGLWQKYVSLHPEQWYQWKKWGEMKVAS